MPQILLARGSVLQRYLDTQHLQAKQAPERRDWLPGDLDDDVFGMGEARATHHELIEAWEAAKAKRDGLPAELKEIEDARIEALANGGKPPPHPDAERLALERAEVALGAEIKLLRWCDRLLGALREMAESWDEVLEGREEGARQARADALRTVERADLDLAELAGQRAYVAAVLGGDGQAHYGEAIQPAAPLPPQPLTMPRTGMEAQFTTVT